jgi:hypothetical protein
VSAPYRNENDSLRAENERLRGELGSRTRVRILPAVALVVVDGVAFIFLRPWLNEGSDAKFWSAVAILMVIAGLAVASAFIFKSPRSS